ncbi:MAG TPA: efflux RND transporter permease subunit [Polyangiaceae bacterium]|nr:efflux RND transporter permease subunit [Polyangiaceae bacterium]
MNISRPFIARPVATTLVMVAVLLFGLMAYVRLPVAALPDVDFPTIQVNAQLPGASAETMAASVATPLEREFSAIDGMAAMTSENTLGLTNITLQFDLKRSLDSAAQDVQSAIARALPRMPRDMPSSPSYRKVNPADQSIVLLGLSSKTLPLYAVDEYAETRLAQAISQARGVAQVQVFGAQKYAVRVQVDPRKLAELGIGLDDVTRAIQGANVNLPTGVLYGPNKAFSIDTNGQLETGAAYSQLIVAYKNGAPVRIADIGRAIDSVENDKTAAWLAGPDGVQRAVVLGVQKQPGANTVEVVQEIKDLLPSFRQEIPASVDLDILFDRSLTVKASVHDVEFTLALTLALVVGVIFIFLRRATATIIPSLSMPLAILATFAAMHLLGFSLNNLSLMAITLSVGFVVDDAIVVLENVVRHIEMGKKPMTAAYDACQEIGFTVVSMTISLVAVFLPFLFMSGILGSLFREFAVTIAISILVSGFVSLSLTPMMSARMLHAETEHGERGWFYRVTERGLSATLRAYERTLEVVLGHRRLTLLFSLAILVATGVLFQRIPKGFLPTEDTDQLSVTTEAVQGISFEALADSQQKVVEIIRKHPDVEALMSSAGSRGNRGGTNQGTLFLRLKPRSQREHSAQQVAIDLNKQLASIPTIRSFIQVPPPIRLGGRQTKSEYQLTLKATDTELLYEQAPRLAHELSQSAILTDVTTDVQLNNPQISVDIARTRAAELGVSVSAIENALYSAYGSRQVSNIYSSTNSYQVILELDPRTQREPNDLRGLYVRSDSGALVPLESVASLRQSVGPLSVNHSGQLPAATVSFNVRPGNSLSEAVAEAESAARRILPAGVSAAFQGSAEAFQASLTGLGGLLLVSVFVIYLVLGILYESLLHPLTILSALPFAGFGALLTLMLFRVDLNVYAFVGVILLVGLVKKNGIMMVDFAIEARKDPNVSAERAIREACSVRFRPIMMTTMAALLGTLPIALGFGAGAESRQPLGLAVVGGLLFSQILTLYVTPVFYLYMESFREWWERRRATAASHPEQRDEAMGTAE